MLALQIWGGAFYLLNKICLSFGERTDNITKKRWKVSSWVVYLIGLPAVVTLLSYERNWIFAGLEAGGAPAMMLGMMNAWRGRENNEKKFPTRSDYIVFTAIVLGLGYSIWDFGGITTINQLLEIGAAGGFLVGTYLLAKDHASGYLWYFLMNGSAGILLWIENYSWFAAQQVLSILFVADAYFARRRKRSKILYSRVA